MSPRRTSEATELSPEALQTLINKKYGEGTVIMGDDPSLEIKRIPTGILSLDYVLGGGVARGRHTEFFGGYSVGKTYAAYRLIASAQRAGLRCVFIDVERSYDREWAARCGIDTSSLSYHRQKHGNRVVDFMELQLRAGKSDVIVLDSIAALLPIEELESEAETASFGTAQAKLMSKAMRKLTAANQDTALIYINQTREAVGSIFNKRTVTSGGRAMGFYAGTRVEMVMAERIKKKTSSIDIVKGDAKEAELVKGHRVLIRVEKDKTGGASPYDESTFVFDYDAAAIDPIEDLIYVGRREGLVHKSGTQWWVDGYEDEKQVGRNKFRKWIKQNRAVAEELEEELRNRTYQ